MGLSEALADKDKKGKIVADCAVLIDEEVGAKGGLSSIPLKAGYKAVKSIKPGFISHVLDHLLPEFATKVDPIWAEGMKDGDGKPADFFQKNRSRVADALLSVTDEKAKRAKSGLVQSTYQSLRGTAKKHVEDAVPRLSKLLEKYA
jgi:hypothetical protein